MSLRQLKVKYAGSKLGIWWAVVTPILLSISITFIFKVAFKIGIPNFSLFVLAGLIPWLFSTNALGEVTNSFVAHLPLLRQAVFPKELIPFSTVLSNLLNFLIGLVFILPLFIISNFTVVGLLPILILVIILNLIFVMGLGLLFSCIYVFFKDLSHFLSIGFTLWFWITPIFYSMKMVDFPYRWLNLINPMSYFVVAYQQILSEAKAPSLFIISIMILLALVSIITGYTFFIKKESVLLKKI